MTERLNALKLPQGTLQIPDPNTFGSPQEYLGVNRQFNLQLRGIVEQYFQFQQVVALIRARIEEHLGGKSGHIDVTIATAGSDGRLEKCLPSLYEPIALIRKQHNGIDKELHGEIAEELGDMTSRDTVLHTLEADAADPLMKTGIFSHVEVKPMSSDDFLYYNNNPKLKKWPSRIMDSRALGPDEGNLITAAKHRLFGEIRGDKGKQLVEQEDDRHRDSRNIIARGGKGRFRGQDTQHYDLDQRQLYYAPERGAAALKHGPLRGVQTLCCWKLMQALRHQAPETLLQQAPTPTTERIGYLADANVLKFANHGQVQQMQDLNDYMLWMQHKAGYAHHVQGQPFLELSVSDAQLLAENLQALDARMREVSKKPGN
jgi:hypothetical protein